MFNAASRIASFQFVFNRTDCDLTHGAVSACYCGNGGQAGASQKQIITAYDFDIFGHALFQFIENTNSNNGKHAGFGGWDYGVPSGGGDGVGTGPAG